MIPKIPKKCKTCRSCRYWKHKHWTDGNGIFRFGKCANLETHVSVEEGEKHSEDPNYEAPCWEAE